MKRTLKKLIRSIALTAIIVGTACATGEPGPVLPDEPDAFSVVWMSDTQTMSMKDRLVKCIPPMFQWIVENREQWRIKALIHTGDVVENGNNPRYWERMNSGFSLLPEDLPVIAAAGNHDVARTVKTYKHWNEQPFVMNRNEKQRYLDGAGCYEIIGEGENRLLIASLGWNHYNDSGFAWLRQVFNSHPDCVGILSVHSYLSLRKNHDGIFTKEGKKLRENVVKQCRNIRFVLCGHIAGSNRYDDLFDDDNDKIPERIVYTLRQNYQNLEWPDLIGFFRIMTFYPDTQKVTVQTYSPVQNQWGCRPRDYDQEFFTLEKAFYIAGDKRFAYN